MFWLEVQQKRKKKTVKSARTAPSYVIIIIFVYTVSFGSSSPGRVYTETACQTTGFLAILRKKNLIYYDGGVPEKAIYEFFGGGRAAEDIRGDDGTVAIILFAEKRDNSFSSSKPMTEYRNARRVSLWDPYRNRQTSFYKNVRSAEEICRELTKNRRGSEVSQITKRTVSRSSFLRKIQTVLEFSNTPPVSDIGPGF